MMNEKRAHTAKRTLSALRESSESGSLLSIRNVARQAVGYVRASTDMQAAEALSIDAQQAATEGYGRNNECWDGEPFPGDGCSTQALPPQSCGSIAA
jgi:hypothetical protein